MARFRHGSNGTVARVRAAVLLLTFGLAACGSQQIQPPMLTQDPEMPRDAGSARVIGIYSASSGFAVFTLCDSGRRYAVSDEAAGLKLRRTYDERSVTPGEPMLAIVRAHLLAKEGSDAEAAPLLTVLEIERLDAGLSCADATRLSPDPAASATE